MSRTMLDLVSEETMRFMRGNYVLDEVSGKYYDVDCLKFRQGKKTILSINIHEDYYDFQIIYGKAEREKFEKQRDEFPKSIVNSYDEAHTYHDGKWMLIRVDNLETLEVVKKMIIIKKKPNRKPFPKETAIYTKCWHRCDLCIYYSGSTFSEDFRKEICARFTRVYHVNDFDARCPGCSIKSESEACEPLTCAKAKDLVTCHDCNAQGCAIPPVVSFRIEPKSILADDITWAVLPYVHKQCGN